MSYSFIHPAGRTPFKSFLPCAFQCGRHNPGQIWKNLLRIYTTLGGSLRLCLGLAGHPTVGSPNTPVITSAHPRSCLSHKTRAQARAVVPMAKCRRCMQDTQVSALVPCAPWNTMPGWTKHRTKGSPELLNITQHQNQNQSR